MATARQPAAAPRAVGRGEASMRCALLLVASSAACADVEPGPLLSEEARARGLVFDHDAGIGGACFLPEHLAGGAALFDCDGDGDLDAYLLQGSRDHLDEGPPASAPNRLFLNDGDGRFSEAAAAGGLGDRGYGMAVAVGDVDNDGDLDVYVANHGPDAFFRNLGRGAFVRETQSAGLANAGWACAAGFFDYDLDGWLDLYVANYLDHDPSVSCTDDAGRAEYCGPLTHPPRSDVLFRNRGDGTFEDVSHASGITSEPGRSLGVVCDDLDGDGWPDVLVACDAQANLVWRNRGDGTFDQVARASGLAHNGFGKAEAGMGVALADTDGDGRDEVLMTHLASETNTYYRPAGAGSFYDRTAGSGLGAASLAHTGFGLAFCDLDLDGHRDLVVANGRVRRGPLDPRATGVLAAYGEPNSLFLGRGDGTFAPAGERAPAAWREPFVSRALAVGDVDGDGAADLLLANCDGPAQLFLGRPPANAHWLAVRAFDPRWNRDAYGARVTIEAGGRRRSATVQAGGGFAAAHEPSVRFGLGTARTVESIEVRWPGGAVERYPGGPADRSLSLLRGAGRRRP
ncbi:MAG: CRTAC1 family protein [Planctomycetota bacterium]|nr:CRTAC1 family protein [Planctomycetota bacterium]